MTDESRQSPTQTVSHVERHPGPFIGPDVDLARACAVVTIADYGNDTPEEHQRIMAGGIWNDHIAVQTALTAIHSIRKAGAPPAASPDIAAIVKRLREYVTLPLIGRGHRGRLIQAAMRDAAAALEQLNTSHRPEGSDASG